LVFQLCETLSVPEQYATIQGALEATTAGDTVRVAPGVYHKFLSGPQHPLVLTGWYSGDTLVELRTLLDPIPDGPDTPSVAIFYGDSVVIRNFAFYNRPEMRQEGFATRTGACFFKAIYFVLSIAALILFRGQSMGGTELSPETAYLINVQHWVFTPAILVPLMLSVVFSTAVGERGSCVVSVDLPYAIVHLFAVRIERTCFPLLAQILR